MSIEYHSASSLKSFLNCPFAFKCQYIDKLKIDFNPEYFRFGTEFHENIKELVSQDERIIKMVASIKEAIGNKKILEFEKKYSKEIDGFKFYSIIDAECEDEILEFKSSSGKWYKGSIENNFIQATLYQKITGKKLIYYVTDKRAFGTQEILYPYTDENWHKILGIINTIATEKEYKKCNQYMCLHCKVYA